MEEPNTSPKRMLLELAYPNLNADVANWIDHNRSWQSMADEIRDRTGISVSRESLRNWYGSRETVA